MKDISGLCWKDTREFSFPVLSFASLRSSPLPRRSGRRRILEFDRKDYRGRSSVFSSYFIALLFSFSFPPAIFKSFCPAGKWGTGRRLKEEEKWGMRGFVIFFSSFFFSVSSSFPSFSPSGQPTNGKRRGSEKRIEWAKEALLLPFHPFSSLYLLPVYIHSFASPFHHLSSL